MKAILIDITKCNGCEECVQACQKSNHLEPEEAFARLNEDKLSSRRFTTIIPLAENHFARKMCLHCLEPACVDACLVGALTKTPEGPVVYNADKCIGCRYCMLACPMDIPRYEWDKQFPYMRKCGLCFDKIQKNEIPACVKACNDCKSGVCFFGDRDKLLQQAKQTMEAEPKKYIQHVYGEKELGGTCVLYVSDVPLEKLGWPANVGDRSIHSYTWPILSKTPWIGGSVFLFLTGTYWIMKRRMKLQAEAQKKEEMGEKK